MQLGQNEWSIDGSPNLGNAGIAFTPFTDQISEFKIETTNFDASVLTRPAKRSRPITVPRYYSAA